MKVSQTTPSNNIKIRPLISYALSSHELGLGGDHFQALTPLFAPIVSSNLGGLFSAESLSKEIQETYGLHVNEHVVKNFIPSMVKAGLLQKTSDTRIPDVYRYAYSLPSTFDNQYKEFNDRLTKVFEAYHSFIRGMHSLTTATALYDTEQLEEGLINWILRNDKRFDISCEYKEAPQNELDFIASEFLQFLEKKNPQIFNDLALLYSGAIISEFVLDFKAPESHRKKASDLNVILDAPFVMNLLGLSGKQQQQSTMGVLEQLRRLDVKLHIFKHSCEEIEGNIDGVLHPDNTDRYGPLARAIASREVEIDYVKIIRNNLEEHIQEKLNLKIFDPESFGTRNDKDRYFSPLQKDRLYDYIPRSPEKEAARLRDVESVATIMRWRERIKVKDFLKSKYLFVTNNKALATQARKFCIDEDLIKVTHAPPVISIETLSGILFLTLGDIEERVSLSRKQLLSSCAKVAIIKPELVEKLGEKLATLSPKNAEQIETILKEPKTAQLMLNLTWGNSAALTPDNAEDVIQLAVSEISAEETAKYKKKLTAIEAEKEKIANDNESLREEKIAIAQKQAMETVRKIDVTIGTIKILVTEILIISVFISAYGFFTQFIPPFLIFIIGIISVALSVYAFWWTPESISKKIEKIKKKAIEQKLKKVGIKIDEHNYRIDYTTGEICLRKNKLL
ncbi:MAG: hypothetical protein KDI13_07525 [Alphaproteobacteria bacterium]|nr:hypothetical protein [Alphaproteobacteria bacterium]